MATAIHRKSRAAARANSKAEIIAAGKELLDQVEASIYLDRVWSPKTLANWRSLGTGPAYIKRPGQIFYRVVSLRAFIEQQEVQPDAA